MKRNYFSYLSAFVLVTVLSFLWGCDDEKEQNKEAELEPDIVSEIVSELNLTTTADNKIITFTTNKEWSASVSSPQGDTSWCSIFPLNGSSGTINITISTTENTGYDDRSAILTIKTGNIVKTLTIIQMQKNAIIISKDNYEISEEGGIIEIEANTNVELEVSIPSEIDWVHSQTSTDTRALTTKKVILKVDENNLPEDREAIITFSDKKSTAVKTVTIKQKQKSIIIVSKDNYEVSEEGGIIEIEANTNVELEVSIPSEINWVHSQTSTDTRALTTKKVILKVDENNLPEDREAIITFSDKKSTAVKTVTIKQKQKSIIIVSKDNYEVSEEGGIIEIEANTNVELEVSIPSEIDWIHHKDSDTRALSLKKRILIVEKNMQPEPREATITMSDKNNSAINQEIKVIQNEKKIETQRNVHVENSGTLEELLGVQYQRIEELIISGKINGDDIEIIRSITELQQLDISNASIVSGGTYYPQVGFGSTSVNAEANMISKGMFSQMYKLRTIILPNNVIKIGEYAFYGCTSLISINIPDNITDIGHNAFYACTSLTSVSIPNSVTEIGNAAFSGCGKLTSITLPNVTNIGSAVFSGCASLASIDMPNIANIGHSAFMACVNLTSVTIPNSFRIEPKTFKDCTSLTSVSIPNGVWEIGESAFEGCIRLTSVTVPNSITDIGAKAFAGCTNLTIINIPDNIVSIGDYAFSNCNRLTSISIPNSYTPISIGKGAFANCTTLTTIDLPDYVRTVESPNIVSIYIEDNAFMGCSSLTSITIPNRVESISSGAFKDCTNLTSVIFNARVESISNSAFAGCISLTSITIPSANIETSAFQGCTGLTYVAIPDVRKIGINSFYHCENLTSVMIGSLIESIGNNAFAGCKKIDEIRIQATTPPAGDGGIPNKNMIKLHIPKGSMEAYKNDRFWKGFKEYIEE